MSNLASLSQKILADGRFEGIFPGWGSSRVLALNVANRQFSVVADTSETASLIAQTTSDSKMESEAKSAVSASASGHAAGLGTIFSVSIAGCDLMGSCLYTAGVCTFNSGKVSVH